MEYTTWALVSVHQSRLELVWHANSPESARRTNYYSAVTALSAVLRCAHVARISDTGPGIRIPSCVSSDTQIYTWLAADCASLCTLLSACSRADWPQYI